MSESKPTLEELVRRVTDLAANVEACAEAETAARREYDRERRDHTEAKNALDRARADLDTALDNLATGGAA